MRRFAAEPQAAPAQAGDRGQRAGDGPRAAGELRHGGDQERTKRQGGERRGHRERIQARVAGGVDPERVGAGRVERRRVGEPPAEIRGRLGEQHADPHPR